MKVALDTETEKRIQQWVDHGYYLEPAEVVARALELLEVETFLKGKARDAVTVEDALAILDKAPKVPPMPGDELPEGWTPRSRK